MNRYIEKAIEEVLAAQNANFPLAALSLALTLPDICSQAEVGLIHGTPSLYVILGCPLKIPGR